MLSGLCVNFIKIYQIYIKPWLPCACRFSPTCSEYTKEALIKFGLVKGLWKGAGRILRCHPFSGSAGYDPLK